MNINQQEIVIENLGQSPGCDPKTSKRNSGLFSFLKWFKPSTSRESVDTDIQNSRSSSCDSLNSVQSNGTVASFSFIPASAYDKRVSEKFINPGPETDTYKARLKQREKRRENDKNLTLRKKYNLFFNRDTLKPRQSQHEEEDNTKSLPLMTRKMEEEKMHRRTASESSKVKRAGAYCHVKGKRRAPQPPSGGSRASLSDGGGGGGQSTMSLKRKKRLAPPPPAATLITPESIVNTLEYADADVIFNDSLKLDHGVLKSAKEDDVGGATEASFDVSPSASARSSYVEAPVSPRPWYKRNITAKENNKKSEHKYEPVERLPEVPYTRNSNAGADLTTSVAPDEVKIDKKKEDKRKSALSFLTNISELDREASEIVKKEHQKNGTEIPEMPEFMRPKQDSKISTDSWASPKRKSARDLIAKFNAITNVTKVTVNSAFFGPKDIKRDYFERQTSLQEQTTASKLKRNAENKPLERLRQLSCDENKCGAVPLMKSESASAIRIRKPDTPKFEKKSWYCPKCSLQNEYWRIICYVCSTIKPYFDDLTSSPKNHEPRNVQNAEPANPYISKNTPVEHLSELPGILERSKTQIGFSVLTKYNNDTQNKGKKCDNTTKKDDAESKKEEREKLKKMLIEMKNSLPKRKCNVNVKQNSRASVIEENPELNLQEAAAAKVEENKNKSKSDGKTDKEETARAKEKDDKTVELIVATTETIYENIKMKKTENPKPLKVSSAAQTNAIVKPAAVAGPSGVNTKTTPPIHQVKPKNNFELLRPKDFANIYSDKTGKSTAHIYENLAKKDELSFFFNMPKRFSEIKNEFHLAEASAPNNADTLEINRLLRRLENAIAKGEMAEAALFAQELAQLKINCSVIRQKSVEEAAGLCKTKTTTFT